jgi:nucleotide-binding universal stress UspA family protein
VGERTGLSVGSSAQALAAHADCPVVIVPLGFGPELPTEGPVVVGVDGSPTSDGAVAAAFAAAAWRKAPLLAVHAWRDLAMPETLTAAPEGAGGGHTAAQREHDDDQAVLTRRLSGWRDHYPNVEVRVLVEMDRPVRTLARLASDAQLVVVGSRGRGGFTGMLLGSTSTALMHTLDVPLLIVRAPRRG